MPEETTPLPVIHVGITVADVQRSMDFYCEAFNATVARPARAFSEDDMPIVARGVGEPGASITVGLISTGNTMLEFLQYDPPGESFDRSNGYVVSVHVCLQVDEIDEVYERLLG